MSADCSRGRAPSRPLSEGRYGSDASGWPFLAVRQEGRGRCGEAWEGRRAGSWRRGEGRQCGHERGCGARGHAVAPFVGAAVAVVMLPRWVVTCVAGHLVTVLEHNGFGVRSRQLLAQHRGRRDPTQGQQQRQQDENEDSQRLHEVEASTGGTVTWCVAADPDSTAAGGPCRPFGCGRGSVRGWRLGWHAKQS